MRLRFDIDVPGDEEAAHAAREELVDRFAGWLARHPDHEGAEAWDADLLLNWKWGYADGDYGRWTRADVDEVLLEHLPRKLSASPEEAATIPVSLGAFVRFLDDEGLLDRAGDPAEDVANRALAQQRAFLNAMADPANFGMAKRLFSSGHFQLGDEPDQAALDEAMARFNVLSFEERGKILGLGPSDEWDDDEEWQELDDEALDLPPLPVRPLPSVSELDAVADTVPLVRRVDALHAALGPDGVALTKAGNPKLADAGRLVAATGVGDRVEGIRSSAELPGLFALGRVAMHAGAIATPGDKRLVALEDWADRPAGERWQRVVDAVLEAGPATLRFGASVPIPLQLAELADQAAVHFLAMLWLAGEPAPTAAFVELLSGATDAELAPGVRHAFGRELRHRMCRDRAADVVATLSDAGVIAVDDDDDDNNDNDDGNISLTDAGARLVAPTLREFGFGVLLPEEAAGLDAAELLDLLVDRDIDADHDEIIATWTADRDPAGAANELVAELVAAPEPVRMLVGFGVLERIGPAAVPALEEVRDDAAIGPHAWLFLAATGAVDHADIPRDVVVRAGVDIFAATAEIGTPADVVESLLGGIPAAEQPAFIDELAAGDHPRTGELLELLGRHHPDKDIGKHARKSAHRWRSAHGARRGHHR
ncbi:MAG: hypothetical protein ACRD0G_11495 [Acidimicrobiales bacterium]